MWERKESAIIRAQKILRKALEDAAHCLHEENHDASILIPLLMDQFSVYIVEYMCFGKTIYELGGADKIVKATLDPLEKMLHHDIADRLEWEKKQTKQ